LSKKYTSWVKRGPADSRRECRHCLGAKKGGISGSPTREKRLGGVELGKERRTSTKKRGEKNREKLHYIRGKRNPPDVGPLSKREHTPTTKV